VVLGGVIALLAYIGVNKSASVVSPLTVTPAKQTYLPPHRRHM